MYKGKKMKMMLMGLAVCFALLGSQTTLASPAKTETVGIEGVISPLMTYFSYLCTDLDIRGSGLTTSLAYCDVDRGSTSSISILTELQQKQSNGSWQTIKSWTATSYGDYCEVYKEYYVAKGQYRNKSTYTAYGVSGGSESIIQYSNTYTY